jgi:hypothetical protein
MTRRLVTKIWVSRLECQQEEEQALSLLLLSFKTNCIPSAVGSESEANATKSEETYETEKEIGMKRVERSRIYSVESLLRSRHSVGSESDTQKEQAKETK